MPEAFFWYFCTFEFFFFSFFQQKPGIISMPITTDDTYPFHLGSDDFVCGFAVFLMKSRKQESIFFFPSRQTKYLILRIVLPFFFGLSTNKAMNLKP